MRSMFAYFTPTHADGTPLTTTDRCLQALELVAIGWMCVAIGLWMFTSNLTISAEAHRRLWTLDLVCFLISGAIYSVLIPLRHILKDRRK